jgi:hypothetical protein
MKFNVTHARAFQGNNISVGITAEGAETIRSVNVKLDGFDIESEDVSDGTTDYQRDFNTVGDAGPGMDHTLFVTAMDQNLNSKSKTYEWTDF